MTTTSLVLFFITFSSIASAHTGMAQSSTLHHVLHIVIAVGLYLAMMAAGFYLLSKLPKPKRLRIKK